MGGLYLHFRAITLAGVVGLVGSVGLSCSCSDRVFGDLPKGDGEPACLWLIAPHGVRADGSSSLIYDHELQRAGTVCLCLTQEDYDLLGDRLDRVHFPESGTLLEEYNELAYDECKRLSALDPEGFVDDECRDYYDAGEWLKDIYFSSGEWGNGAPPGFTCYE